MLSVLGNNGGRRNANNLGPRVDWERLFAASAAKLKASLDEVRAGVDHRGLKGHANEQAFAEWLEPHLPGAVGVCTGEVIDSEGKRSRQVDLLLYDRASAPMFLSRGDVNVLPIEVVYSVIEVKTYLNKGEMEAAFENMMAVKALTKSAYHQEPFSTIKTLYGNQSQHWPVQFFIFAYESDGLDTLLGHVTRLNDSQPIDKRIDMVCVLDKGLLVNMGPDGLQPIPMPNTRLIVKESSKALLTFYALVAHLLGQARSEPLALHPYLRHIRH